MFTLLHISDLHRSASDPISNDELLSSLLTDRDRFSSQSPAISSTDAVIVSGDLIQGMRVGEPGYPGGLQKQYEQALDFLVKLSDTFTGGQREKVVLIPGNHDVDWNRSFAAMETIDPKGQDIPALLSMPGSPYRWSWKDLQLYRVAIPDLYEKRLEFFCLLYEAFYYPAKISFPLEPTRPWNLYQLDQGRVVVAAFNSCSNNDCFSYPGEISPEAIAQAHLEILSRRLAPRLKIAVWHHDVQGPPRRSDYMDSDIVRLMIDKGFRLGLHGHQHRSDAVPYSLIESQEHTMAVVSAGSLCAGPGDLPRGISRQYNVIEIQDSYMAARIHVREMNVPGVFFGGRLVSLGGASYTDVKWTEAPMGGIVNTARSGGHVVAIVEEIEGLINRKLYEDALRKIESSQAILGHYGRQLMTKALFGMEWWSRLAEHLRPPSNGQEFVYQVKALAALQRWDEAERAIADARCNPDIAVSTVNELSGWLKAERGTRS
jgi:Calcineurin-like phosphoesterase